MPERSRGSPCIGVCSTTYGDLICRGCYRFAHEVSEWNGYGMGQRVTVQERIDLIRSGACVRHLSPERIEQLVAAAESVKLRPLNAMDASAIAYEVLRRLVVWRRPLPWREAAAEGSSSEPEWSVAEGRALLIQIEREMFERSRAHYERNFRLPSI